VIWQPTTEGHGVVTALLERHSALIRPNYSGEEKPLAANISQLVIVLATEPPPSEYLLDQYLVTAENIGVKAVIAMNKIDLLEGELRTSFDSRFSHYQKIGYPMVEISAKFNDGLDPLLDKLQHETSILVGQSGVGKSSLIKALLPDLNIQIGRLSEASGLGKHTTSATTLYSLPEGGRLIDSPGVRSFRLVQLTTALLENGFKEFRPFLGHCKFSNCSHKGEPGCALTEAVEQAKIHPKRLQNHLHMADKANQQ
jgi:ribosome biogenesis GTPase